MGVHGPGHLQRFASRLRTGSAWALCVAVAAAAVACREASAAELVKDSATVAERSDKNTVHWNVDADGDARIVVNDDRENVVKQVAGKLTFAPAGEEPRTIELEVDPETGILHADGPELPSGVTEVRYTLNVNGKPRSGALYLPESGTKGLRESGDATGTQGPHGGSLEVAAGKTYEILADSASGQVRVYLLDDTSVRPQRVELALDADAPKRVALTWHTDGYYLATIDVRRPPRKVSLVVLDGEHTHVVLVGYRPGSVLIVDAHPVFWVHRGWHHPGLRRGHFKGTSHGPPGHDHDSGHGKLSIKAKSHGKGGHKVQIKVH